MSGEKSHDQNPDPQWQQYLISDPQSFLRNLARMAEAAGQAAAAFGAPRKSEPMPDFHAAQSADMVRTLSKLTEYWLSDPTRALEAQTRLFSGFMDIWAGSIRRTLGEQTPPAIEPEPRDRRFNDPEWSQNAFFDFMKQVYLVAARWAGELIEHAEGLDDATRLKARFYVGQIVAALAPSNYVLTNPAILRETARTNGENLVRGLGMLAEDIRAGGGELRLRQVDESAFQLGRNLATTSGKVVARSELAEIIQYDAATQKVLKRPLIICPPWINKYYILDLNPEKSFIRWAIEQGHTVFVISWVNPDRSHAEAGWDAYYQQGLKLALDTAGRATGTRQFNLAGYCVGGTLLAASLALMAKRGDDRAATATFLTTQVDFTHAGDLKVFVDEEQISAIEKSMHRQGYLDGTRMALAFNILRANELIWPYVVNNYMLGRNPSSFDLLYWNSDSTRLTAANHSFYLRNCYLENNLSTGRMVLDGERISLSDVTLPIFSLATREDHIAPARSVFLGLQSFGGTPKFVLAGSGHIAGVVNPPQSGKYQYWTGGPPKGELADWLESASVHAGSWWPCWNEWIRAQDATEVKARKIGRRGITPLGDAPGEYVRVRV